MYLYFALLAIILTLIFVKEDNTWSKLLSISSLSVKIAIFILLFSVYKKLDYLVDVGVFYLMLGTTGTIIITLFLMGSGEE